MKRFLYFPKNPCYNGIMKNENAAPTMKDVAREAGVSLGTVSKVFNGIHVGEEYKRRVLAAAEKLQYRVNSYARGLKTNRTDTVALLIPTLRHPFFAALTDEIAKSLARRNLRMLLSLTNYDPEAEQKSLLMVQQNKVDGVIGLTYNPNLVIDHTIPFVTIDRHFNAGVPCVSSDNYGGGEIAAEALLSSGAKRLLFLRFGSDIYGEVNKREAGFVSVCRRKNVPYDSMSLSDTGSEAPIYDFLKRHIKNGRLSFDGIFCNSDHLASHLLTFFEEQGIRVPKDVQIVGYDGIKDYFTGNYSCSTIVQPVADMAEAAVDLIINRNTSQPALVSLPVRFEAGGTTRG